MEHSTFYLFGFSGGIQFTHRFVMAYPEYIVRAVAGGAGVFTFPDYSIDFPYGLNLTPYEPLDLVFDLERGYLANMSIMVGLNGTLRTDDLSQTPEADAQGSNRLERAQKQ